MTGDYFIQTSEFFGLWGGDLTAAGFPGCPEFTMRCPQGWGLWPLVWPNLRSGVFFFCFFVSLAREGKKITPSSRERVKGIIGRGHDLRLNLARLSLSPKFCTCVNVNPYENFHLLYFLLCKSVFHQIKHCEEGWKNDAGSAEYYKELRGHVHL